jgi:hypothetical protein
VDADVSEETSFSPYAGEGPGGAGNAQWAEGWKQEVSAYEEPEPDTAGPEKETEARRPDFARTLAQQRSRVASGWQPRTDKTKYQQARTMLKPHHEHETIAGHSDAVGVITALLNSEFACQDMAKLGIIPAYDPKKPKEVKKAKERAKYRRNVWSLLQAYGWAEEQIDQHLTSEVNADGVRVYKISGSAVSYVQDPAERGSWAVVPGPEFTHAQSGEKLDTSQMYSKFSGRGWGIFVMDRAGNMYVGRHRVGLFHHSSFLAGKKVAAAGEIRVIDGRIQGITAKSGHYMPGPSETQQVLQELAAAQVPLAGLKVGMFKPVERQKPGTNPFEVYWAEDVLALGGQAPTVADKRRAQQKAQGKAQKTAERDERERGRQKLRDEARTEPALAAELVQQSEAYDAEFVQQFEAYDAGSVQQSEAY